MRDLRQFWSQRRIGEDRVTLARLGALKLWLARADKEWAFAYEHGEVSDILDIAQVPEDVVPSQLNWKKSLFKTSPREYILKPAVPDRAVVVKPTHPVMVPEGESGTFFLRIPAFVRIMVISGSKEVELGIIPTRPLSDTWFGGPTEGEFAYSLPTSADRDLATMEVLPHHIVCQVEIQNESSENLTFEKLCFRPQYVGLFCGNRHIWSSMVRLRYEGYFKGAHVRYRTTPPDMEANLLQLAPPQKREDKGLSRLTFSSGFGRDIIFGK